MILKITKEGNSSTLTKQYTPTKLTAKEDLNVETQVYKFQVPEEVSWKDLFSLSKKLGVKITRDEEGNSCQIEGHVRWNNRNIQVFDKNQGNCLSGEGGKLPK